MKRLRLKESYGLEVAHEGNKNTAEAASRRSGGPVIANLAAIHAGTTKNDTVYGADKLRGNDEDKTGVASWTHPYQKPVLTHHNKHSDPIGRVEEAKYVSGTKPFIKLKVKVSEEEAAQKVLDGRYDTVSIGAETDSAICSICGTDIVQEGFCGHMKGKSYEGETARWILGNLWFNEVSYVNVPADDQASTLSTELVNESAGEQVIDKLGDGTAVLIVVPEEADKPLSNESAQNIEESNKGTNQAQKGATELPEDKKNKELTMEELQSKVETLTEDKEDLETKVEELTEELEEANEKVDEHNEKVEELKTEKQDLAEEKSKLLDDINEQADELHRSLAERIVDMRVVLGKPIKEEEREDEVTKYAERSSDSLNDTMSDLVLEYREALPGLRDQIEAATNPGAAVHDDNEPGTETEGVETDEDDDDELTGQEIEEKAAEVLSNLFSGNRK